MVVLLVAADAQAYLDAGTASLIFQTILAAFLSGLVILRLYWQKVVTRFARRRPQSEDDAQDD